MTSVFMIFELTQDYQVFVPLMIANMVSFAISKRYQPISLYHALLQQDDVHLPTPGARPPAGSWRALDIMSRDFTLVPPDATAKNALALLEKSSLPSLLVGDDGLYTGLIQRDRVEELVNEGAGETPISGFLLRELAHAHPDHPLEIVLERLSKNPGVLPVVSRKQVREVLGIITPQTVMHFLEKTWSEPASGSNGTTPH
jgi:CIC family chloride channel protein